MSARYPKIQRKHHIILDQVGRPRPYMAPDIYQHSCQGSNLNSQNCEPKVTKYFVTLTCSHGGVKVKMMYMLQIYIVHSIDWYQHWRNRLSNFGGEANTNYYPSAEIIHKIEVFRDLDLQSWRGPGQNEVHVAHLHCSLS